MIRQSNATCGQGSAYHLRTVLTRLPGVISTVRRRRAWSTEEKVAILDAAFRPGGSVAGTTGRFDVSRALIYLWRKHVRAGLMPGVTISEAGPAAFAPVAVVPDAPAQVAPTSPERAQRGRRHAGLIEVRLVNGRTIRADESIDPAALARIAAALDRVARWRAQLVLRPTASL
jgi:transposase